MENDKNNQFVDPKVSKLKFKKEIAEFKALEAEYRKKGVFCYKISKLSIHLIYITNKLYPNSIVLSICIDYKNWDTEPPSIKFINPFTEEELRREDIKINLNQTNPLINESIDLIQGGNNIMPFLCIPGVKEYHSHPAHSGDSWFLYRTKGEGKLCTLIDQIYNHSIVSLIGYNMKIVDIKAQINGFTTKK